jgi:biotin carboxyl carrier protein
MTDSDDAALEAISRAAAELVPELTERGELRLRLTATPVAAEASPAPAQPAADAAPRPGLEAAAADGRAGIGVASPAVGFFVYADGLGPGIEVGKGDALGHVEMLGVRHDVLAPRRGTVRHLVAESGEAVEYGQVVLELEAAEAVR